jgi:hypothetical protein
MNPTGFKVSPPTGGWPTGARVTVTVDADAKDALGVKIAEPASATFVVAAP